MRRALSTDEIIESLSTRQVLQSEQTSYESLNRYRKRGWIQEPMLGSYGKGGGKGCTLWWPVGVIFDLIMIRTLRKAGFNTNEIDNIIKGEES